MENTKSIVENPSNINSNTGVPFANSNTPGFLVPNKKIKLVEENSLAGEELTITNEEIVNKPQQQEHTSLLRKQSIDVIEEAQNEFEPTVVEENFSFENNLLMAAPTENTTVEQADSNLNDELINNPSSIFNIPLITSNEINNTKTLAHDNNNNITSANDNKNLTESIANKTIQAPNIDFFAFDFTTTMPNVEEEIPHVEAVTKTSDDVIQVDFNSVIRASDNQEVIPEQDDRVELTKFLEPRENIIKKPGEVSEEDNNVIRINDDSTSDTYRSKNNIIKYSLYSFYVLLAVLLGIFLYRMYKNLTGFSLTRDEITLAINSTYQAEIVSNSKIQDNTKYEWSSNDTSIVKVDENGLITSVGEGEAVITVKKANQKKTLKVTTVDIEIESITFEQKKITLKVGEEYTLQPIINNDKTIVIDLLWETSDESLVTVNQNGHIVATGVGTASIFVYDEVSGLGGEIEIEIEPSKNNDKEENNETEDKDDDKDKIAVTGIALNKSDTIMVVGEYIVVSAVVRPANATNKSVTWSSSNSSVATVSSSGKITARKVGTATITATTKNGKTASIKITVTEKFINVTSITLNVDKITLDVGETTTLKATIKPDNATNKGIIWSSNDESIAIVSSSGKVTAKKAGTATIIATTKDGNKKDVATITVKEKEIIAVTGVSLNADVLELDVGNTYTLTATINPSDATIKDVEWSSSDSNVATVENGKIVAKSAGTATITVKTTDGNKTATCTVTVKEKVIEVSSISLNETSITLVVGESFQLVATIDPSNATNKTLTWTSSKNSYASVDSNGLVTAKKAGTAVITVKAPNGKKRTCSVKIVEPETSTEEETETTP